MFKNLMIMTAAVSLVACSNADSTPAETTTKTAVPTATSPEKPRGADMSTLPSGTYKSESGHAYITFQYMHQGYSRPTLRWNEFEATVSFDPEKPDASTLNVVIQSDSIDSGVSKFDTHLKGSDMFDVEKYPTITFVSTDIKQSFMGAGQLTGDLTMKGVTKPITLKAVVNKVGESRGGTSMFGISATTSLKRSEWDVGYAVPYVGDDVDIKIEVEFQKAE